MRLHRTSVSECELELVENKDAAVMPRQHSRYPRNDVHESACQGCPSICQDGSGGQEDTLTTAMPRRCALGLLLIGRCPELLTGFDPELSGFAVNS